MRFLTRKPGPVSEKAELNTNSRRVDFKLEFWVRIRRKIY